MPAPGVGKRIETTEPLVAGSRSSRVSLYAQFSLMVSISSPSNRSPSKYSVLCFGAC